LTHTCKTDGSRTHTNVTGRLDESLGEFCGVSTPAGDLAESRLGDGGPDGRLLASETWN